MALLSLNGAHFDYGREKILRGVVIALQPGVKYALVGANGAGKTTLLAALAGQLELPGGVRQSQGSARIELLRQESSLAGEDMERLLLPTVADLAFAREREIEAELAQVAGQLAAADEADHDDLVARQGRLQDEFERRDGYSVQSRLEAALRGVGLMPETWDRPVGKLSGGERRRGALAAVLLSGAELLLLDEPTNHLDLESCEWLEGFLGTYPGAAVIVSHDRQFLDRTATKTLHLDRGKLVSYSGNYSFFDEQSRLRYQQDLNAWQRQQTKIKQTEEYIRRNIEGQKTKQAQSRRKQMDKVEKLEKPTAEPGLFRFDLKASRRSGGTVIETEKLGKAYGDRILLKDFDLHVSRGDRVGIIGPNGCGKSTLLKMIAGRVAPDHGRVVVGHNVDLGYYDQELSGVSDHNTVMAEMASVDPVATIGELRSFLGAFGFGEDLFDRQVGRLSGGERGRLSLMRLIKEGHNTLLLDEPTNHLDVRSCESLEASLREYDGTMIVVSHDRRFLDKIVERLIVFPGVGDPFGTPVRMFDGNYTEWVRWRGEQARVSAPAASAPKQAAAETTARPARIGLSKNEIRRREEKMGEAEAAMEALEAEKDELIAQMASPDLDNARRAEMGRRCQEIESELQDHMADWEQWGLELEGE
jgi:ATP-binding cassette subfamily F protein 3